MTSHKRTIVIVFLMFLATGFQASHAQHVEDALASQVDLSFEETQLDAALAHVSKHFEIPTFIDTQSMATAEIQLSELPVSLKATNVSLGIVLDKMLAPHDLAWFERHDVLWITTAKTAAEKYFDTRVYRITRRVAPDRRLRTITQNVEPESWSTVGGPADAAPIPPNLIVIFHSPVRHREIAQSFSKSIEPVRLAPALKSKDAKQIDQQLSQPTEIVFKNTTLGEAVQALAKKHGIKVEIDNDPFSPDPISADMPINIQVGKVRRLSSGLSLLLDSADDNLTWIVDENVIKIMSAKSAASKSERRTYHLKGLSPETESKLLMEAAEYTIAPSTWRFAGGNGSMELNEDGTEIVISQSQPVHRQLQKFFAAIRAATEKK